MKKYFVLLFCILLTFSAKAQNKTIIDSLMQVYKTASNDTIRIFALTGLAFEYRSTNPDTSIVLGNQALRLSESIQFIRGQAWAYNRIGVGYYVQTEYNIARSYYEKALVIFEKINDKAGMSACYNNLGLINSFQANYPQALQYYFSAYKINEGFQNKINMAGNLSNIGVIYNNQSNYALALEYHQRGLKIYEEVNDKRGIGISYNNMGFVYASQAKDDLALEYHQKALKIRQEIQDKRGMAETMNNIGNIYAKQANYALALEYQQKAIPLNEAIQNKRGIANNLNSIAQIQQKQGEYDQSIESAQKGLLLAQEIKALVEVKLLSETLYQAYKLKENYTEALYYHELYKNTSDSVFNADKAQKIANLENQATLEIKQKEISILSKNKELLEKDNALQRIEAERQKNAKLALEKQAEADRLLALARQEKDQHKQDSLRILAQQKQLEADNLKIKETQLKAESQARQLELLSEKEEKELQQYINYLVITILCSVLILAYFIYRSRQKEKNAKEQLAIQKEEIQQINEELQTTLHTVNEQKDEIALKSQAIRDSIAHAQRIQKAILPTSEILQQYLPQNFILFQPLEMVSGDFYYFQVVEEKMIIAAIDCTGHGVPGAFMTMITSEILDEIIQNRRITTANEILNELHKRVRIALKQEETDNRDGMDLSLLVVDKKMKTAHYAGAHNPLIYFQNNTLFHIRGDRKAIGGEQREAERLFTQHAISIEEPTTFYLFSDGFQDQFGGKEGKKFTIARLKNLLLEIHQAPLNEQQKNLEQTINSWIAQAQERQIDDILVWGIKV
ncbi:MAG: hypothetical protein EAZ55_11665 [Cytophagales bacterium]|nr:MAG: hypothetical protein EAZ55_11665 [Cytophagales bacterium]